MRVNAIGDFWSDPSLDASEYFGDLVSKALSRFSFVDVLSIMRDGSARYLRYFCIFAETMGSFEETFDDDELLLDETRAEY